MTHIHIPDGVLPTWLWLGGWLGALAVLWLASRAGSALETRRRVPLLAVMSALMLVAMSSEIVPLAYHLNLTVLAGTLLGPVLAPVAAFIVTVILALLGHGGITVIGLNTLMFTTEMVLGGALVRMLVRALGRDRVGLAGGVATVLTLATTTALLVGMVALAGTTAATVRETGALNPSTLSFSNPLRSGVFKIGLFSGGEKTPTQTTPSQTATVTPGPTTTAPTPSAAEPTTSVKRFAAVVFILGPIGWVIEAFVTALILGYIARVRPGMLWAPPARMMHPLGHESGAH